MEERPYFLFGDLVSSLGAGAVVAIAVSAIVGQSWPALVAMVVGMSVSDVSQKAVANLGWERIALTAPVFVGETIYAESEVLDARESKSRPTQGVVTVRTTGKKADGTVFISFERTVLVPKEGHATDDATED